MILHGHAASFPEIVDFLKQNLFVMETFLDKKVNILNSERL